MSHGIYVTTASWTGEADQPVDDGAGLNLKYEIVSNATTVTSDEVGAVVRSLLTISDEREWTPGRLEVTSLTTDGAIRGRWRVEREWFERLGTELSQVEFSRRVLTTIENNRRDRDS
nr:hypothetical protein [Natrinema gelatinilyticum]